MSKYYEVLFIPQAGLGLFPDEFVFSADEAKRCFEKNVCAKCEHFLECATKNFSSLEFVYNKDNITVVCKKVFGKNFKKYGE